MTSDEFISSILKEFAATFEPLEYSFSSFRSLEALLAQFGWPLSSETDMGEVQSTFAQVSTALTSLEEALGKLDQTSNNQLANLIPTLVDLIRALVEAVRSLSLDLPKPSFFPLNRTEFWESFPEELLQFLVYRRIEIRAPFIFGVLHFLGILSEDVVTPATSGRIAYLRRSVHLNRIPTVVSQPEALLADVYGWGTSFDYQKFLTNLQKLFLGLNLPASVENAKDSLRDSYYDPADSAKSDIPTLTVPVYWSVEKVDSGSNFVGFALGLMPIPPEQNKVGDPEGFVVFPVVAGQLGETVPLDHGADLQLKGGFESENAIGLEVRPGKVKLRVSSSLGTDLSASADLRVNTTTPRVLVGSPTSSRLEMSGAHLNVSAEGPIENIDQCECKIEFGVDAASLVIDFGEGDGFLQSLLGSQPRSVDLSFVFSWSNRTGFSLASRGGLDVSIPLRTSLANVVTVDSVHLALRPGEAAGSVTLETSITGKLKLGPITVSVDRVGLQADVRVVGESESRGNLDRLDVRFGFKPPTGLGLLVDAGPITGGGYLDLDRANGRYSGALQLRISDIAVSAIGILDVGKTPGAPAYSFLIILTAEFPSIQIGLGFTLDGIGGIAGLHRSVDATVLQDKIRSGDLGNLLFPQNPVANAPQIISDLQTVFPPTQGHHVFGPLALLGWGTPTLVRVKLGVVLEFPDIKLYLLGKIDAALPSEETPILDLHMNIFGSIDFSKKLAGIDSSLYKSHVAGYPLSGDMAFRLNWGDHPNFALAIGGFNSHFRAPEGFPDLRRVTVDIGMEDNPRVTLQGYLAITSNTVQLGASAEIYAEAWGASIEGGANFEVLFGFSPFSVRADLSGYVKLKAAGHSWGVSLDASLTGPHPWRAKGYACVDLVLGDIEVPFDVTIGEPQEESVSPPRPPSELLLEAISDVGSWSAALPAESAAVVVPPSIPVTTAETAESSAEPSPPVTLFDPGGSLTFRQKIVPLDRPISKFGEASLPGPTEFKVVEVKVNDQTAETKGIQDLFAAAQFIKMNDSDKLSRDSFELMGSGVEQADPLKRGGDSWAQAEFDTCILEPDGCRPQDPYTPTVDEQLSTLPRSLIGIASRTQAFLRFAPKPGLPPLVTLANEQFVIASKTDATIRPALTAPVSKGLAMDMLSTFASAHPEEALDLQVVPLHEVEGAA